MKQPRSVLALVCAVFIGVWLWSFSSTPDSTWITNTTMIEPAPGVKATVQFHRIEPNLIVELKNFPSFRSQFKQPDISNGPDGSVTVFLESASAGLVSNKSEQFTHISMKLPSQSIPPQSKVSFHSNDYDQVFVSGVAP